MTPGNYTVQVIVDFSSIGTSKMDIPAKPTPHRTLRLITIIAMIPALSLLIPSAIFTHTATPTLGLIPMSLSCVVSLTALGIRKPNSSLKFFIP